MTRKHLLYLGSEQLCAYRWHGGRLSGGTRFNHDRAGVDAFMDYIDQGKHAPVYLLADLIEEDFQRVQVPHVGGRAGAKLMRRRLLQQYRETPFRHHEVQGREPLGRRDDIVLLSALTNPSSVQPWAEALEQLKIPLAGLYSTTLLSEALVRKLGMRDEHLLLVTQQSAGWRQSYFQNGQLKFSRLTPAIDRDGDAVDIGVETGKTQQFLTSVRLMARGNVLETAVIAPAAAIPALEAQCAEGAETAFRFVPLEGVTQRLGVKPGDGEAAELAGRLTDPLLLSFLARASPPSHYTLGPLQRYFKLWHARVNLYRFSAMLAVGCVVLAGINLWQSQQARGGAARLAAEAALYDQRYGAVMAAMPPRVTTTANMRAAVNVERMLVTQGPGPQQLVAIVSAALEQSPQIRLLQLDWKVNLPAAQVAPGTGAPAGAADMGGAGQVAPMSSLLAGIPGRPPQALLLEAEIMADQDDYRNAVNTMNLFARQLASHPRLTVEVDKPPLDTRSSVKLNGKAGAQAVEARAKFSLNLVWKP
ncbi:MAG: hypothetical protein ABIQ08_09505 [Duganella sp.]